MNLLKFGKAAPVAVIDPTAHLQRPRLHSSIQVHPPVAEGEPWLLQRDESHYFRIGADLAALAAQLDGARDNTQLAAQMGGPWTPDAVDTALGVLDRANLVAKPQDPPARKSRRIKYVPPLTVQFTVLRSGDRLARWITSRGFLSARALALTVALLALTGIGVLIAKGEQVGRVLGNPLPLSSLVVILAAVAVTTVAHELGHASLLSHYGGRPGRLGVMIFYLSPAMFCDVSDAWRLNHLQRARVALAGIMVQIGVSGAAACASGFAGSGEAGDLLVLFSIVNLAASVINTVPFVKLDGYIALMSYLDRPNLRAASMASVRERCVALLTGKPREVREPAWLPWFGIACVAAPVVLVVRGLGNWLDALLSLGYFGYFLSAAVGCFLVIVLFRSVRGFVKALRGAKVRPLRAIGFVVVVGALLTAVAYIPVTTSQNASYAVTADGQVELRIPQGVYDQTVQPGDRVDLVRSGMVLHQSVGTAAVTITPAHDEMIPLTALIPVRVDDVKVPGSVYRLTTDATGLPTDGSARLHSRSVPLIRWTYERFLKPFTALFD